MGKSAPFSGQLLRLLSALAANLEERRLILSRILLLQSATEECDKDSVSAELDWQNHRGGGKQLAPQPAHAEDHKAAWDWGAGRNISCLICAVSCCT